MIKYFRREEDEQTGQPCQSMSRCIDPHLFSSFLSAADLSLVGFFCFWLVWTLTSVVSVSSAFFGTSCHDNTTSSSVTVLIISSVLCHPATTNVILSFVTSDSINRPQSVNVVAVQAQSDSSSHPHLYWSLPRPRSRAAELHQAQEQNNCQGG